MNVERAEPGTSQWAELAAPHLARYLFAAERVGGRRMLDLGSGAGYGAAVLRSAGAAAVLGVDADAAAVARAQARHGGADVSFVVGDCQELADVAGGWDVISCFEAIEHVPRPEALLAAAARRLGANGTFILSTPDRAATPPFVAGRPRNRFHEHEWYRDEFAGLAAPSIADFPVVPAAVADVYGSAWFTVAICRQPIGGEAI